ncbi:MAG: hypothetical protein NT051_04395 [Candidatus Micrarchaeota archaeon]|nr:hypothetical protein [Candidatus Micrarchaeota archaeon]
MAASAFCPAYITGMFLMGNGDAAGAGFAIDKGLTTTVEKSARGTTTITVNGVQTPTPVSKVVLRKFLEIGCKPGIIDISHKTDIPVGFGLGMSAAGALSLSLALNEMLGAGLSRKDCVKMAHEADFECGTGLSGVDAAAIGGVLFRKDLESKPEKIDCDDRKIHIAFFSPIRTSSIIRSEEWKEKVNKAGAKSLLALSKKPSWDSLLENSRRFAIDAGLADWCAQLMEKNPRAGMAMLGHTLFSDEPIILAGTPLKLMEANVGKEGAKLLR